MSDSVDEEEMFMPAWKRAFSRCVKAGTIKNGREHEQAFLAGWVAGERHAQDLAAENFKKMIRNLL